MNIKPIDICKAWISPFTNVFLMVILLLFWHIGSPKYFAMAMLSTILVFGFNLVYELLYDILVEVPILNSGNISGIVLLQTARFIRVTLALGCIATILTIIGH